MGLSDNYESIRSRILMKKTLPSLSEVYNLLDQEYNQRSARVFLSCDVDASASAVSHSQSIVSLKHLTSQHMASLLVVKHMAIIKEETYQFALFVVEWVM